MIKFSSGGKVIARARQTAFALICLFALAPVVPAAPELPPPSPSPPVFVNRPFGPKPAPTPPRKSVRRTDPAEPLPRKLIVGLGLFGAVVGGGLLFFGARVWRMSRLFGRQYRFPVRAEVPLRFGGERSGGLVATATFAESGSRDGDAGSKPKDA